MIDRVHCLRLLPNEMLAYLMEMSGRTKKISSRHSVRVGGFQKCSGGKRFPSKERAKRLDLSL